LKYNRNIKHLKLVLICDVINTVPEAPMWVE